MSVSQPVNGGGSGSDSTQSSEKDEASDMPDKQAENRHASHSEQRDGGRGKNPSSKANLKPFQKGESGNPGGKRMKGQEFIDALSEHGKTKEQRHNINYSSGTETISDEGSYNFQVVDKVWNRAREGELPYIRLLNELGALKPTTEEVQERVKMKRNRYAELAEQIEKGETTFAIRQQEEGWQGGL
jgi:E3 ubiquitin-protein ligase DOA10